MDRPFVVTRHIRIQKDLPMIVHSRSCRDNTGMTLRSEMLNHEGDLETKSKRLAELAFSGHLISRIQLTVKFRIIRTI